MTAVTLGRSATFPRSCIGTVCVSRAVQAATDATTRTTKVRERAGARHLVQSLGLRGHGRGKPGESKADLGSNGHSREPYAGVERP